jgi:adenylate cyclase
MIWNSVPLMTVIDLVIIGAISVVVWRNFRTSTDRRPSAPKAGLKLILLGLLAIAAFYFVDLLSMHVLPAVIPMAEAMEIMGNLHLNSSWLVSLFAIAVISFGFMELKRTQEELAENNQLLEGLSSKLSRYLSPQVYQSIFRGEQEVKISSRRKKLTVFFCDIVGFTETADNLEPEELTNWLNHYLTEMSKIALEHGATIDKYIGDAIMAFFGDPDSKGVKEDATACVKMAIAMQRRSKELQSEWLDLGLEKPFQLRIGINTGYCTVGNFGSEDRMDYTIIGNEVNLAARLESHASLGGILLAQETYALVKDTVMAEEGDTLTVKGFAKPVRTFRVVGLYDDLAEQGRVIRKEQEGLALAVDRDKLTKESKAEAIKALEEVLAQLQG